MKKWLQILYSLFIFFISFKSYANLNIKVLVLSIFKPKKIIIKTKEEPKPITVEINDYQTIKVNGKLREYFIVKSDYPIFIEIKDKMKRNFVGQIEIYQEKGVLQIVNKIVLETYLEGVVASEMGNAPPEMLKTQAIMARTKALEMLKKNRYELFHVNDLTSIQVYKGIDNVNYLTKKAVFDTKNRVLSYQKKLAQIFYSSTCGGGTTTPEEVWRSKNKKTKYLKPIKCRIGSKILCRKSPHFKWSWKAVLLELAKIFQVEDLIDIKIIKKDQFGRVFQLKMIGKEEKVITAEKFRIEIGRFYHKWGLLKSSMYKINRINNCFIFEGTGLGHGVGLCQWGAKALAKRGYRYQQILKFYFPKLEVKKYQYLREEF